MNTPLFFDWDDRGELKAAEPMLRANSSSVQRSDGQEITAGKGETEGERGGAALPSVFSSLLLTTATNVKFNASATAKKAECLYQCIQGLIRRVGIERVAFVTLTFADHVTEHKEASRRFHNLAKYFQRQEMEFISVPERQESKRLHFHLVTAFADDIRTGFDFASLERARAFKRHHYSDGYWLPFAEREHRRLQSIYHRTANHALRKVWVDFRIRAPRNKFGRCETLPIISNAHAISRYLAAYVTSATRARLMCDKGSRSVRYGLRARSASIKFSWVDGHGKVWRRGLMLLGHIFGLDFDGLKERFTGKFQYDMRRVIGLLGRNFEKACGLVYQVPEWADVASRVRFLSRLCDSLQTGFEIDWNFVQTWPDCPF